MASRQGTDASHLDLLLLLRPAAAATRFSAASALVKNGLAKGGMLNRNVRVGSCDILTPHQRLPTATMTCARHPCARNLYSAILGLARRRDCPDGNRLYGRYERDEAQRSDGECGETQNVFHTSSYPFPFCSEPAHQQPVLLPISDATGFS
jgi:hypothetical protein